MTPKIDRTGDAVTRGRKKGRRSLAALGAGILLAALAPGLARGTQESFVAGSGTSSAQVMRAGPTAAQLSLAPTYGLSLADYVGTVGRGETTTADWAALGVSEPQLTDNTPRLKVVSTEPGAADGKTEIVAGGKDPSGNGGGGSVLFARATKAPFGESSYHSDGFEIPGVIKMGSADAKSSSGVFKGSTRISTATVDISELTFAGGLVGMKGMHWEAVQQTGAGGKKVKGSFTVESASAGGLPLVLPAGTNTIAPVLTALNAALAPTGFRIVAPTVDTSADVARVSPMSFEIVNSPLGRTFLGPVLDKVQPVRKTITDFLISASGGEASVAILVADLTIGIASGASQFHLDFGGVNSFTEGKRYVNPFGGVVPPPIPTNPPDIVEVIPGKPGKPGVPAQPATKVDDGTLTAALPTVPQQKSIPGSRGGAAAAVGLVGLALIGGLGTRDYYLMRRSRSGTAAP